MGNSYLRWPLEKNGDPDSWKNYTVAHTENDQFVRCRIHGVLARAALKEELPIESKPRVSLPLDPPFSPERLDLPSSATEISLQELRVLLHHRDVTVRRLAALGLRRLGNQDALPALASVLKDPDEIVRKHAVWGIGALGQFSNHRPDITPMLNDPSERVRDFTAFALATTFDENRGARLSMDVLANPTRPTLRRIHAAVALARGFHSEMLPELKRLQSTSLPPDLRAQVDETIARISPDP